MHRAGSLDNHDYSAIITSFVLDDIIVTIVGDMITFQRNKWADHMDSQVIGALALVLLAFMGVTFQMEVPPWLPIVLSAFSGSVQSLFARVKRGFVKGAGAIFSAFIAGMTGGLVMGYSVGVMMGLEGSIAIILPVYIFALMGGRLVLYIATGVSIEEIGNTIIGMFTKDKN